MTAVASQRAIPWTRWILFFGLAIGVLVVDQATKGLVTGALAIGERVQLLGEWLTIVHSRNSGALFGLMPQSAGAFAAVSIVVLVAIVWFEARQGRSLLTTVALGLLLGGAIGNLLDRLRYGSVVDFIDMGIGNLRFFTYNVADAAITGAILLFIVLAVFPKLGEIGAGD
jgi:signal peptidase II